MKKSITIWMPVMLAVLCMAVPAQSMAAGKHSGTALRKTARTVVIKPPHTSVNVTLKADDPAVTISNGWICMDQSPSYYSDFFGFFAKDHKWVLDNKELSVVLDRLRTDEDRIKEVKEHLDEENPQLWWKVNPAQGQLLTHSWKNCYTKQEIEAAWREIRRWDKFVKDHWLPAHKGGKT